MPARLDTRRADAFARLMTAQLNHAMLALMTSIGHRTGLFQTMARLPPATSAAIAAAAGLHERYVREWLAAMVTGRIVDYDGAKQTFALPPEHAVYLARGGGDRDDGAPDTFAACAQRIAGLAALEDDVVACFVTGAHVAAGAHERLRRVRGDEQDPRVLQRMLALLPDVARALEGGIAVLDVRCAAGRALSALAARFPRSQFTGYDTTAAEVAAANREAAALGLGNAQYRVEEGVDDGVAAGAFGTGLYDLVTAWSALHDQDDPARRLRFIHAALRPGGRFLCIEIAASSHLADNLDHPLGPMLYATSTMHSLPLAAAAAHSPLGVMWGEENARRILAQAGFSEVVVRRLEGPIARNCLLARKG
jgi:SAM-dependent methyltransferase